jgi:glutamate synthase (NADPH/NADH) large chain/glutamate synthase (ferredoxin)
VGVATQDPVLRAKFTGQPEHVINYFFFVAEEVREWLSRMGFHKLEELVGRVDRLEAPADERHWKARGLDLSAMLAVPQVKAGVATRWSGRRSATIGDVLDKRLFEQAQAAIERGEKVRLESPIRNTDRTTGTYLSSHVARRYGEAGLPDDTITVSFKGSAGQSFGAFLAGGITLRLEGEANDYVGKGLSGGKIVIKPPPGLDVAPEKSILLGNTSLYGATRGEAYLMGVAGERFAVRNSGALAVVEGTGDHGCEYMTGGTVLVLGRTGRNFAAGMSGGIAFVLNEDGQFEARCNRSMVELERVETPEDAQQLRRMLEAHMAHTGSAKAKAVLDSWDKSVERFVKVIPIDYKRAMAEKRAKSLAAPAAAVAGSEARV